MTQVESLLVAAGAPSGAIARLVAYAELVLNTNRRFNLTGAKSEEELAGHLLDSLGVVPYVTAPYVDVGSGAGLPAIPVAIVTGLAVTLVEATRKKALFLERALEALGVAGQVVPERAEVAAHEPRLREAFASTTARAVATAPTVAELVLPFLAVGGGAVLQRGTIDARERTALEDASLVLGGRVEAEHRQDGDRRIIILRKTGPTPLRFPRRTGIPEKRPLCM